MKRIRLFMIFCLSVILRAALPQAAKATTSDAPEIRVLLNGSSTASSYTLTVFKGDYDIVFQNDPMIVCATITEGESYTFTCGDGLMAVPVDKETALFRFNNTTYRGAFKTMVNGSYYYAINIVDVEQYLYGVVGKEIGYGYHIEATKAQAVAARSYAIGNISSRNTYYDVTATTSSQVYGGYSGETSRMREAVDGTRGMVLTYNDAVIQAYFSSNAGGYTENIENVWVSDAVPIKGVPSPYDADAANYSTYGALCWSWTVEYTPAELVTLANNYGNTDIGDYESITMSTTYNGKTSVSGRAMIVTIKGTEGSVSATKDNIRSLLKLKSTLITIMDNSSSPVAAYVLGANASLSPWETLVNLYAKSAASTILAAGSANTIYVRSANGVSTLSKSQATSQNIVITGNGYGHGVGMSQWGAIAMGDAGYSWEEIITHYYCSGGIEITQYYE